jgi:hypothetical protein
MKSFLILSFILLLGASISANASGNANERWITNRQISGQPVSFTGTKNFKSSIRNLAAMENPAFKGIYIPDTKNIHARALRDFQDRFNDASDVKWFSDDNGFISYFFKDGYSDRAFYNNNGRWQYSLIFYAEDKLPQDIRAAVKSVYFDLDIVIAEEVQTTDGMVYVVYLEDKSNIRILKVSKDGELKTMMELVKG